MPSAVPMEVETVSRNLLHLPREILVLIFSFTLAQPPIRTLLDAWARKGKTVDKLRLRSIGRLCAVCRTFRIVLFSSPTIWITLPIQSGPSGKLTESSFLAFFGQITCKAAIRSISLEDQKMLGLRSVHFLLESCPNLERLCLKNFNGFPAKAFLEYFRRWSSKRIAEKAPRLKLKEIDVMVLGLQYKLPLDSPVACYLTESDLYVKNRDYWFLSGASFVLELKKLLDLSSAKGAVVKPAPCDNCMKSVALYERPISCSECSEALDPYCILCQDEFYHVCSTCMRREHAVFSCMDCTDEVCGECGMWTCEDCGGISEELCRECRSKAEELAINFDAMMRQNRSEGVCHDCLDCMERHEDHDEEFDDEFDEEFDEELDQN
jgi:hypothetical protein